VSRLVHHTVGGQTAIEELDMARMTNPVAQQAKRLWDQRDLQGLVDLCSSEAGLHDAKTKYYGGLAYHALNDKRMAMECWREAMSLNPSYSEPIRALAYELMEREDLIDAAELFHHLIRLRNATPDDLAALGDLCIKQGRLADARRVLEQALESEPTNALALVAMATANAHMRNSTAALEFLRRAAETTELDLSDLDSDPAFHFLWHSPEFEQIISGL
jgi:tetratricopeptide (TPR) repeat protein